MLYIGLIGFGYCGYVEVVVFVDEQGFGCGEMVEGVVYVQVCLQGCCVIGCLGCFDVGG